MLKLVLVIIALLLSIGIIEKLQHQKRINAIPLRVNVNGTRGKSTVTRLITAILTEANVKTVGKTTGSAARMLYWFSDTEKKIKRKPEGPNIREQKEVVKEAAKLKAEALVSECMAINPEYQMVFQKQLLQANIGVITNVLPDHLEIMGPTLDHVAKSFTSTIPYKGHLVITPNKYLDYFKQEAERRGTKIFVAQPALVSEEYLAKFNYVLFPENVALALAVAEILQIDQELALAGMLKANPDPGVLRVIEAGNLLNPSYFINAFAANDPSSTLDIWQHVQTLGYNLEDAVIVMNCRADRIQRTLQFTKEVLPFLKAELLVLIGEKTEPVIRAYKNKCFRVKNLRNLEKMAASEVYEELEKIVANKTVFCIGNIQGVGEELIEYLQQLKKQKFSRKVS